MFQQKIHLRLLLTSLTAGGIIVTCLLLMGALFLFQKSSIEESLIESNIAYAQKLADTTDRYLRTAQQELAWSASQIKTLSDVIHLARESDRLRLQSGFFNTVVVVNRDAVIAATSPESIKLVGVRLNSVASRQSIDTKKPFISPPFTSATGNYVIFISQPLFTPEGNYLGYIGGTIYLKKQSMLSDILSQHFLNREAVVSIVSNEGLIIFSHDPSKTGERMDLPASLQKRLAETQNGRFSTESDGHKLLIGYANLRTTGWNIFMAGTTETVSAILMHSVRNTVWFIIGLLALTSGVMALLAGRIALPLERLAAMVREGGSSASAESVRGVKAWYYEADCLAEAVRDHRRAVSGHMAVISDEAMTDPLTGLYNRRGFNMMADRVRDSSEHCIIAIDIDHFKKINDTFGHDAGDVVLVSLAALLRQACRPTDTVSRFGGEEFIVLLPHTSLSDGAATAERIRLAVSAAHFPGVGQMTVSAGVAVFGGQDGARDDGLRRADEALYQAKRAGRNHVSVNATGTVIIPSSEEG
ncbi:sensor domain-containing diguanylate cyclase [Pantoea stewartii]|uniref:sensor domain-containing diguanylate cyclase n=1 Tax=Pantoea stewartii TaxID=66269 RepID=UPI002DB85810|nr:sensor domain-containing diguanylate cyclase [Pantoea stewartii]MEB6535970.1 sensor domain-containing diguanylate cyclase [Pantoea stewartii]